jgi:hypothetical protein
MDPVDPLVMAIQAQRARQRMSDISDMASGAKPSWLREYEQFKNSRWQPTQLPQDKEIEFRNWLSGTDWFNEIKGLIAEENNVSPSEIGNDEALSMILDNADYDYRGAWASNPKMERDPYDNRIHWASRTTDGRMLKSPQHPTAWKEFFMSETGRNPDELGFGSPDQAASYVPRGKLISEQMMSLPAYPEETY